jgi:hypothetical protein
LLTYSIGALELSVSAVNELAVCWNNAFRKIFHYKRWESVKQLQYFCDRLDFKHMYDLARYKFLMRVVTQLPHLSLFCASRDMQHQSVILLRHVYVDDNDLSFVDAFCQHFKHCFVDVIS